MCTYIYIYIYISVYGRWYYLLCYSPLHFLLHLIPAVICMLCFLCSQYSCFDVLIGMCIYIYIYIERERDIHVLLHLLPAAASDSDSADCNILYYTYTIL